MIYDTPQYFGAFIEAKLVMKLDKMAKDLGNRFLNVAVYTP
jgi:hypothetical protein